VERRKSALSATVPEARVIEGDGGATFADLPLLEIEEWS
jgi:hypothetical protein